MFPHGSGGASQAIVDTRVLGACLLGHGVTPEALLQYEGRLVTPINELVMRNRGEGPMGVLIEIEDRIANGAAIAEAIDEQAVASFMARYKEAAGTARDALNSAPDIISRGA